MNSPLRFAGLALTALLLAGPALAAENGPWLTGTSLIGTPKYAPGFAHYDYVNPDAPKGGTVRLFSNGTFDTFNPLPSQGQLGDGIGLVYESLMDRTMDEDSAEYPGRERYAMCLLHHCREYARMTVPLIENKQQAKRHAQCQLP